MMGGLCPNLNLMLVVSIFTTHSREFAEKYQDSLNNLITYFMNLSNQMFLFTKLLSLTCMHSVFCKFSLVAIGTEKDPTQPISLPL
jgi:hypothetical protein